MGAMTARDPPGVEVAPWRADRQPDQGLKLGDRAGPCRGGKADALARNGGHDRGVLQDGTAHFMEIVQDMAVDQIGPRAQGHAPNGGDGPVLRIAGKVELPGSLCQVAALSAQVPDYPGHSHDKST